MKRLLFSSGLVITLLSISFGTLAQAKVVPDFSFLRMDNGAAFTKANMTAGKKSLFIFFDPGCSHCQDAMKTYNANNKKLGDVAIYLVTRENKDMATKFMTTYAPAVNARKNVVILLDRKNEFIAKFYPAKFPAMYLYGKDSKLIIYSDEGKDIPAILEKMK